MKNFRPLPEFLSIKNSQIDGLGLFATKAIMKGQYIGTTHYITDKGKLLRTPLGGFYNHSETPNVAASLCGLYKQHGMRFIDMKATKNIEVGEEITADYKKTLKEIEDYVDKESIISITWHSKD